MASMRELQKDHSDTTESLFRKTEKQKTGKGTVTD
jgi:hypothetical protein